MQYSALSAFSDSQGEQLETFVASLSEESPHALPPVWVALLQRLTE